MCVWLFARLHGCVYVYLFECLFVIMIACLGAYAVVRLFMGVFVRGRVCLSGRVFVCFICVCLRVNWLVC